MPNEQPAYTQVLYPTRPHATAAPYNFAAIGRVFGMDPPSVRTARVLEFGCGTGGHLYPLALAYPEASFLGVDLAPLPVRKGNEWIERLGLQNIRLEVCDIAEFDVARGPFDYIIAHGVYSWVPQSVRDRLLELCGELLSPHGIAYVSYNTLPGWYVQNYARDLMRFHARSAEDPSTILQRSFESLKLAATAFPQRPDHFGDVVKHLSDQLHNVDPNYLFHDHLGEINDPVYFTQFVEHAEAHGLQFLWEAATGDRPKSGVDLEVVDRLQTSLIETEQYLDFLRNRRFRQSLLCRRDISLTRTANFDRLSTMYVRGSVQSDPQGTELAPNSSVEFHAANGIRFSTSDCLVQATFFAVNRRFPESLQVNELVAAADEMVREATGSPARPTEEELRSDTATIVFECFLNGMLKLYSEPLPGTFTLSKRPKVRPATRLLCKETGDVVTHRHQLLKVRDAFVTALITELNGEKTVDQLARLMVDKVRWKEVELPPTVSNLPDGPTDGVLTALVRSTLERLAAEGVFEA